MRDIYVKKSVEGYMKKALERKEIEFKSDPDEYVRFEADVSEEEAAILMEDALCEEQRGDSVIPVYSYRVISNPQLLAEYRARNKGMNSYHVLNRDRELVKQLNLDD
ncbi:MAG: hypothetical protein Q4B70_00050 [Lachnospiraceae bacterium]|nr:hypothetical protein [Lachnospiraceae bacterium]